MTLKENPMFFHAPAPSPLPDYAVEVLGLCKTYRGENHRPPKIALKGIDLKIPRGSIFGLLGPNGAGKSTLINILAGLVIKSGGAAKVWGFDVATESKHASSAIGVVPQELNLDSFFTARELLEQQAGFYGVPKRERRTKELLEVMELADTADAYTRALSGGMRRRLMMAKAMVHNPPVLVLDEPTAGVDVELRHTLWAYVKKLNAAGTTILLTTHYLDEAEELCDHIAIINEGALVANDTKQNLLAQVDSKLVALTLTRPMEKMPEVLQKQGWEQSAPDRLTLVYKPSQTNIGQVLLTVQAYGFSILDMTTKETDLEAVFLQLTKRSEAGKEGDPAK
jgi:ABC-2 type transport system ATP-binding protein